MKLGLRAKTCRASELLVALSSPAVVKGVTTYGTVVDVEMPAGGGAVSTAVRRW